MKTLSFVGIMIICLLFGSFIESHGKKEPGVTAVIGVMIVFIFLLGRWSV